MFRVRDLLSDGAVLCLQVMARRALTTNKPEVLVHWEPAGV